MLSVQTRPLIGVTLDREEPGGYSRYPWYALRANYMQAVAACGGLPIALPHDPALTTAYLDRIDALIVTGGAFDVDPSLYGDGERHASVMLKEGRTAAELALLRGALARDMPVLGICGGEQLLDGHEIGTGVEQVRRKGVTQRMRRHTALLRSRSQRLANDVLDLAARQASAALCQKYRSPMGGVGAGGNF